MKKGQIVDAYKALESATVKELSTEERISVAKAMTSMQPTVKEFDAFIEILRDKFKTPNIETIANKIQMGKGLTDAEAEEFMSYNTPINQAANEERDKDVDIEIPKVGEEAVLKMIGENGWKMSKFVTLGIICS